MALFRDLNFAEQRAVQGEANRLQGIALSTLNEVVKVALSFLTVALLAAVIVLMMAGAHFAYNSALFVTSLVVLMVGLLCVGTLIAVNHQTALRLAWKLAWFRFQILDSQVDSALITSAPVRPPGWWLPIALGFSAYGLWIVGVLLGLLAFSVALPLGTSHLLATNRALVAASSPPASVPLANHPSESMKAVGRAAESEGMTTPDKIAIGVLAVGFIQAAAMVATYYIMRLTARRQLRAYVFPESFDLVPGEKIAAARANDPAVLLISKNTGQTPAYDVRIWAKIDVVLRANEHTLTVPPMVGTQATVLATNVSTQSLRWLGRDLTPAEIADLKNGTRAIYLFGRIEYRDAFKRKRFTTFRMSYAGAFPPPVAQAMNFGVEGNDAD